MKPILSLILPVYKVEVYVGVCLDSILVALEQVEADESFEVICVDDGSPDRCGEILDSYRERFAALARADRVSYTVIHQKNAGVSAARNAGLEAATGEWLWFIDSDDSIAPFALAYLARALREHPADVFRFEKQDVASQGASFQFGGGVVKNYDLTKDEDVRAAAGCGKLSCFLWHACYRRSAIGDVRFQVGMQPGEDDLFAMQVVVRSSTFAVADVTLYNYVERPGSCMKAWNQKKLRCELDSLALIMNMIRSWVHGRAAQSAPAKSARDGMCGFLRKMRTCPFREYRPLLPRCYEVGVSLFDGCSPFYQALFLMKCFPLILLFMYFPWRVRVALLKFGFVRWLKVRIRGY